ncbi:MAG: 50S ribosomal protein L4 [Patescibacteria group bacterium]
MSNIKNLKIDIYNLKAEKVKEVELNPAIFGVEIKEGLIHQVVIAQMANRRKVLAHTKDKSEVRGGGRKPWRQKGTGRARHGSSRSPIWIGGGVTFGPTKERNFSQKINKKMKKKALFMCLSDRVNDKQLALLDKLELKEAKTKELSKLLNGLNVKLFSKKASSVNPHTKVFGVRVNSASAVKPGQDKEDKKKKEKKKVKDDKLSVLVVGSKKIAELARAGKNIPGVKVLGADSLNVVDVLTYRNIVMGEDCLEVIEGTYLK